MNSAHTQIDINTQKLKNTLKSLQTEIEILRHENISLHKAVKLQKRKNQHSKALKDFVSNNEDPSGAQVFSPGKISQARIRIAENKA
jgi:hypothetical protein